MESIIQEKINHYCSDFRMSVLKELYKIGEGVEHGSIPSSKIVERINELKMKCTFVPFPTVIKGEFKKRTRTHTVVPEAECCMAMCSNGSRCSRRRQEHVLFCGTHVKGQPNGSIASSSLTMNNQCVLPTPSVSNFIYPRDENGILRLYHKSDKQGDVETFSELVDINAYMKNRIVD